MNMNFDFVIRLGDIARRRCRSAKCAISFEISSSVGRRSRWRDFDVTPSRLATLKASFIAISSRG